MFDESSLVLNFQINARNKTTFFSVKGQEEKFRSLGLREINNQTRSHHSGTTCIKFITSAVPVPIAIVTFFWNLVFFPKLVLQVKSPGMFQRKLTSFKNGCWTERNSESKFGWLSTSTSWLLQDFFPTKLLEKIMLTWPEKFFVEFFE